MKHLSSDAPLARYRSLLSAETPEAELRQRFLAACDCEIRELYESFLEREALRLFTERHPDLADLAISRLGLPTRLSGALLPLSPDGTLKHLLQYSKSELVQIPGVGAKGAEALQEKLKGLGVI